MNKIAIGALRNTGFVLLVWKAIDVVHTIIVTVLNHLGQCIYIVTNTFVSHKIFNIFEHIWNQVFKFNLINYNCRRFWILQFVCFFIFIFLHYIFFNTLHDNSKEIKNIFDVLYAQICSIWSWNSDVCFSISIVNFTILSYRE